MWGRGVTALRLRSAVLACALFAGVSLSACAVLDRVDPRYDNVNRATAYARNQSILLNIIRASQYAPLNFLAFSKITGQMQATVGAGMPNFLLGPAPVTGSLPPQKDVVFNNTTLNSTASATNSFDISILESKDFYSALLRPVDLVTLHFFIRQGYSRQLLFWLFADSVEETIAGKTYGYRFQPGKDPGCNAPFGEERGKCFRDLVDIAFATGLTVETRTVEVSRTRAGQRVTSTRTYGRFCFDAVAAAEAQRDLIPDARARIRRLLASPRHLPRCRGPWNPGGRPGHEADADTLEFIQPGTPYGTVHYRIVPRSTFGIYQFLGRVLAAPDSDDARILAASGENDKLLTIVPNRTEDCFDRVFYEGVDYCVPQEAKYTKQILQLLAQLLALQTQAGDLAVTPTVRISP